MAKTRLATSGFLSLPSSRLGRVAGAAGLLAMIVERERSWTLVSSVALLVLVVVMMVLDLTGTGP